MALRCHLEDPLHHIGLSLVDDHQLPGGLGVGRARLRDGREAVHLPAGPEAVEGSAFESPVGLLAHDLERVVVHHRQGSERDPRILAVGGKAGHHVNDGDVGGGEVAEDDAPGVAEIAAEPRKVIHDDRLERTCPAASGGREHPL